MGLEKGWRPHRRPKSTTCVFSGNGSRQREMEMLVGAAKSSISGHRSD